MRRVLAVVTALVVAGMLWGSARPVAACQCAVGPDKTELEVAKIYVDLADVILIGTVIDLVADSADQSRDVDARVTVERYLKGSGPADLVADDPVDSAACGIFDEADRGKRMVIFLYDDNRTGLCTGTSDASEGWIRAIESALKGMPEFPITGGSPVAIERTHDTFPTLPATMAATVGPLAFLAAVAFLWRRKGGAA